MIEWVKIVKESPIDWLLEKTNPSVRYFALRDILDEDENSSQVVAAKTTKQWAWILESAPIERMQTNIEAKGKPSKWITLIALRVLKRLGKER